MKTAHTPTLHYDAPYIHGDDSLFLAVCADKAHHLGPVFAVAPELLAALEALANCPDYRGINTLEMRNARAAIAKAKGEP